MRAKYSIVSILLLHLLFCYAKVNNSVARKNCKASDVRFAVSVIRHSDTSVNTHSLPTIESLPRNMSLLADAFDEQS